MGIIEIENMEFFAYHGHFDEERVIGNKFIVNIALHTNLAPAAFSDDLDDAVDYQKVYHLINKEMQTASHLLEHIAKRILEAIYEAFPVGIDKIELKISKLNPPIGGKIDRVSITMIK